MLWDVTLDVNAISSSCCCCCCCCREGSVVVADNLKIPGAPEYVKWMKQQSDFSFEQHSICMGPSALWLHDIIGVSVYKPATAAA